MTAPDIVIRKRLPAMQKQTKALRVSKQGFRPTLQIGINGFPYFVTLSMEEFTLGSHSYSRLMLQLIVYPAMSHFLKLMIVSQTNNSCSQWRTQKFSKGGGHPGFGKGGGTTRGLGAQPPANF